MHFNEWICKKVSYIYWSAIATVLLLLLLLTLLYGTCYVVL